MLFIPTAYAKAPIAPLPAPVVHLEYLEVAPILPQVGREYTKGEMVQIATQEALKRNLDVDLFLAVIKCESGWNRYAVGDGGTSFGLAQFHYPLRDWGITREQAQDPAIALPLMAKAWSEGKQNKWTCYGLLKAT